MNCGTCHGVFDKGEREPLLLPACGHSLCRPCLSRLTMHRGFLCPICRQKQPNVELSSLHPNHALLEVITAQKEGNGRNAKKTGGKVDDNKKSDDSNSHNNAKNKGSVCSKHGGSRLAYWCGACQVAGCGECVVDEHGGGGGGGLNAKRHEPKRLDAALRETRDKLQYIVHEVTESLDRAETENTEARCQKSSFVTRSRRLLVDIAAVMGKLRLASSFLACQIQEREDEDASFARLRQEMNELLCQVPPASSSSSAAASVLELQAVMAYHKEVEKFRSGPVANMLKERASRAAATTTTNQRVISSAAASLNALAATLCRKVAHSGELEVVGGGGGCVRRVSWNNQYHKLHLLPHLHCLRRPPAPRPPPTHPSRRYALKWSMVQTMMHEVTKVFMVLAWGQEQQWIYFKLHHSTTSATATATTTSPHRRFISHLLDGDNSRDSLLGTLSTTVTEVVEGTDVKGIYLGTHDHEEREDPEEREKGKEHKMESKAENTGEDNVKDSTTGPSSSYFPSAGDVVCVREQKGKDDKDEDSEGDLEFWLVTEGTKNTTSNLSPVDCMAGVEVVGSLLPLHHQSLLGRLPGLVGVRVEDCGVLLPCDRDEEEEGVGPNIPSRNPDAHHQHQHPALISKDVQTVGAKIRVLGVVRRQSSSDTHSTDDWGGGKLRSGKVGGEMDDEVGGEKIAR